MFQIRNSGAFDNAVYHHTQNNITPLIPRQKKKKSPNIIHTYHLPSTNFHLPSPSLSSLYIFTENKNKKKQTPTSYFNPCTNIVQGCKLLHENKKKNKKNN